VTAVDTFGGVVGTLVGGQLRTATGDYFLPFAIVTLVAAFAVVNVTLIRPVATAGAATGARSG
jgi:hypothetical protein